MCDIVWQCKENFNQVIYYFESTSFYLSCLINLALLVSDSVIQAVMFYIK